MCSGSTSLILDSQYSLGLSHILSAFSSNSEQLEKSSLRRGRRLPFNSTPRQYRVIRIFQRITWRNLHHSPDAQGNFGEYQTYALSFLLITRKSHEKPALKNPTDLYSSQPDAAHGRTVHPAFRQLLPGYGETANSRCAGMDSRRAGIACEVRH